jgi:hypothetical protein
VGFHNSQAQWATESVVRRWYRTIPEGERRRRLRVQSTHEGTLYEAFWPPPIACSGQGEGPKELLEDRRLFPGTGDSF